MKIHAMKKQDVSDAVRIIHRNYPEINKERPKKELLEMFSKSPIKPEYFVAKENNQIVGVAGYIQSYEDYNVYELFWVNVAKEFQGKGIGTKLVETIIQRIKKLKGEYKKALLIELSATEAKSTFYKKFGFKKTKKFGKKECLMCLNLNP